MYVHELGGTEWEKSEQNESNSSSSYARLRSNKGVEVDEIVAIQ